MFSGATEKTHSNEGVQLNNRQRNTQGLNTQGNNEGIGNGSHAHLGLMTRWGGSKTDCTEHRKRNCQNKTGNMKLSQRRRLLPVTWRHDWQGEHEGKAQWWKTRDYKLSIEHKENMKNIKSKNINPSLVSLPFIFRYDADVRSCFLFRLFLSSGHDCSWTLASG